jgi:hypothetical protein
MGQTITKEQVLAAGRRSLATVAAWTNLLFDGGAGTRLADITLPPEESNQILGVEHRTTKSGSIARFKYKRRDLPRNEQPAAVSVLTSHFSLHRTPPGSGYSPKTK